MCEPQNSLSLQNLSRAPKFRYFAYDFIAALSAVLSALLDNPHPQPVLITEEGVLGSNMADNANFDSSALVEFCKKFVRG